MTPGPFAFVRSLKTAGGSNIKEFAQITSAEQHAKRGDVAAKRRQVEGRSHTANYFWSKAGAGLDDGGADYAVAFRAHKRDAGVTTERKGAALAEHLLVGVSPEWLATDGGDPRDIANPRVVQLIEEARNWAESWMGTDAVWAVRYDTDEKGAGIVDILASPIRQNRHKSGSSKAAISVRKAGAELADKHGAANAWIAMQTDWALWAQDRMDPELKRGVPRRETERAHVSPETYAAAVEAAVAEARAAVDVERKELARDRGALTKREKKVAGIEAATTARIAEADSRAVAAADIEDRAEAAQLSAKQDTDRARKAAEAVEADVASMEALQDELTTRENALRTTTAITAADLVRREAALKTGTQALATTEADLVQREKILAVTMQWSGTMMWSLNRNIEHAVDGTYMDEVPDDEMPDDPEERETLIDRAPDGPMTVGYMTWYQAFNYIGSEFNDELDGIVDPHVFSDGYDAFQKIEEFAEAKLDLFERTKAEALTQAAEEAVGAALEAKEQLAALVAQQDALKTSVALSERRLASITTDEEEAVARVAGLEDRIEGLEAEETELRNAVQLTGDGAENFGIAMQEIARVTAAAADITLDGDLFRMAQTRAFKDDRGQNRRFAQGDAQDNLVVRFITSGFQKAADLFERLRSLTRFNDEIERARTFPEPLMQMQNHLKGMKDAITETLTQLGIADQRHDLGETDKNGDPPPVLELVFGRAKRKERQLNQELTARLGRTGPSI